MLSIALASSGPLPNHGAGLAAIYCLQHFAATGKLCTACALILQAV